MKFFSSKRRWAVVAAVVLLLFAFRPGASRLKSRIIASISSGVGRPVDIGSVHLRLLPWPGFDLENLVVYDDAAFGAEPMLRASDVTATLRLASLVRGHIEISRLDMSEPSLNLVRDANGRWNVETLLEHSAHTPLAPTAKARLEPRPAFPYIEATSGRINFMHGPEKRPYALTNADFSLWQDSENAWGVRLKAQPVRTDLNLNDTGLLQVSGTWQRAEVLRDTPLVFTVEWDRPQLGQLTKLISGIDQGWRGGMRLELNLTGTPAKLLISSDASIEDFRRYDITTEEPLRLAAHCDGQYSSIDREFHDILCSAPVNGGSIVLKGSAGLPGSHIYDLAVTAADVPAGALLAFTRHAKKNLAEDLTAKGALRGNLSIAEDADSSNLRFEGSGEIAGLHLASAANKAQIGPVTVPFVFTDGPASQRNAYARLVSSTLGAPKFSGLSIDFGPFLISGRATARGRLDRGGYGISLTGESDIAKALTSARMVGIPALASAAEGSAQLDLKVSGPWAGWGYVAPQGFSPPQVTGVAKLRNVRVPIRAASAPIEIESADLHLLPDSVRVEKLNAKAAGTSWIGSLEMPRGCGTPAACQIRFNLHANQLTPAALSVWITPHPKDRPWYRVLEKSAAPESFFAGLRAWGQIGVGRLVLHSAEATRLSADVTLDRGKLKIAGLTADFLGGKYQGDWESDLTVKPVVSSSRGSFTGASLAGVAELMKDPWISGVGSGTYQFTATGLSFADLWRTAEGSLRFDFHQGLLPHVSIEDEGPLKFARFSGDARLKAGQLEMNGATLDSPDSTFLVSGTATSKRELEIKLVREGNMSGGGYQITGTVSAPRVEPLTATEQARLKR